MNWKSILTNKYVVAFYSAFFGALGTAAYQWASSSTPVLGWSSVRADLVGALAAAVIAVYHLFLPSPSQQALGLAQQKGGPGGGASKG